MITQKYITNLALILIMVEMNASIALILAMILIPIWVIMYVIVLPYQFNYGL